MRTNISSETIHQKLSEKVRRAQNDIVKSQILIESNIMKR